MPACGTIASAPTRAESAPGSTRASGLRNTIASPRVRSAPRLAPAAKPRFVAARTIVSHGCAAAAAVALSSSDALSTTITSHPARASAARLVAQSASACPAFQLTITTDGRTRPRLVSHAALALPHARPAKEDVEPVGDRDEESWMPLEQPGAKHARTDDAPERLAEQAPEPDPATGGDLCGGDRGQPSDAAQVARDVRVGVMQNRSLEALHRARDLEPVVRVHSAPCRPRPSHQPDDRARPPATAVPPATEVRHEPWNGETVDSVRHARQGLTDLGRQLRRRAFVGVQAEHPGPGGGVEGDLLLRPVARPGVVDDARRVAARDLDRRVARAAVHDDDLVAPADAVEAWPDVRRLVLADDRARDSDRCRRRGGPVSPLLPPRGGDHRSRPGPARVPIGLRAEVGFEHAHAGSGVRRAAEGALELHEVLDAPPPPRHPADLHALEVEQDQLRSIRLGLATDQHVHVLQVVVVDAGGVQAAEEVAERARESAALRRATGEALPVPVGGHSADDLLAHEEAPAQHASAAILD